MQHAADLLVYFAPGAVTVKSVGDGLTEVSGLCVVFDEPASKTRDLSGEYFTKGTFFGPALRRGESVEVEATYNHGIASRPELKALAQHDFTHGVKVAPSDAGLVASLILDERNSYEKALADAAKKGALGWSTGSAPHRVTKTDGGQIERWPLVEVALTPTPCEPRTYAAVAAKSVPLSTLIAGGSDALPGSTKAVTDGDGESLTARIDRVHAAVRALVAGPGAYAYPVEVFEAAAIVEAYAPPSDGLDTRGPVGTRVLRVPYTDDGERVTLAPSTDWTPVERRVSYEAAAAKALREIRDELSIADALRAVRLSL